MLLRKSLFAAMLALLTLTAFAAKGKVVECKKNVTLRASRSSSGYAYSTAKAGSKLVLAQTKNGYYGIVMQDGRIAWAPASAFTVTDQVVEYAPAKKATPAPTRIASRGVARPVVSGKMLTGDEIVKLAEQYLGIKYVWGGNLPSTGLDCSGFVKHVFGQFGVKLPRTARTQVGVGKAITRFEDLQPGDRLYFCNKGRNDITHTGLYIGNGYFIHANRSKNQVSIDYLFTKKWMNITVAARR